MRRTYVGFLKTLPTNGIFVFGSNTQGRHGKGAALHAITNFGAVYGQSKGRQGMSYAIITKDLTKKKHPSISKKEIIEQIKEFYEYASLNTELDFYVAYSGTSTNLNGYSNIDMSEMFSYYYIPKNVIFEEEFNKLIEESNERRYYS